MFLFQNLTYSTPSHLLYCRAVQQQENISSLKAKSTLILFNQTASCSNIIFNMNTRVKCTIYIMTSGKTRPDEMEYVPSQRRCWNSPTTIHHSSLEIYINLLWVKKGTLHKKEFIVPWFAISINLLRKSHQSVP